MVACRQRRLQQVTAEEFMNKQRSDVALPGRGIGRRPLACRRQRPCRTQRALNIVGIEAHRRLPGWHRRTRFRIIRLLPSTPVLPDKSNCHLLRRSETIHPSARPEPTSPAHRSTGPRPPKAACTADFFSRLIKSLATVHGVVFLVLNSAPNSNAPEPLLRGVACDEQG